MTKRKILIAAIVPVAALLLMAQTYGPQVFAPFLTVGGGTRATSGLRVNGDVTVTGTCTGCGATLANPTSIVGLSAVNGVAATAMRSDGSPALDQGITPTWTGVHAFNAGTSGASAGLTTDSNFLVTNLNADRVDGADYETGTFTINFGNACTTTPSIEFDYARIGNVVTLIIDTKTGFPCTGDVTSFSGGAVPAGIIPTNNVIGAVLAGGGCSDNAVGTACCFSISAGTGLVNLSKFGGTVCSATAWTAAGNRNGPSNGEHFTYLLGDP